MQANLAREHKEELRQLEEALIARRQQVGQAQRDAQTIEQVRQKWAWLLNHKFACN